jgi:mannose-6-phosphate isomerase-like protein (cupin superfamily)
MFLPLERLPLSGYEPLRPLSSPQDCFDKDTRYGAATTRRFCPIKASFQGAGEMTGILENPPGVGHNDPASEGAEKENQHWDRWAKKRTFVRALEGTYSHLYKSLIDQPRVFSSKDVPWKGGPGHYGKSVISPQAVNITQSIESHIEAYAPMASGQKHGHLNSAVFYVLKGRGHDVHDGRHIPWKAGDVMLVENACVHQHFNDSKDEEAILLVFKAKPLFLFMHLLFQKIVEWPSKIPPKGAEDYKPPSDL